MSQLLAGKVALVTGAGRGIGRAIALAFADEGAAVALVARSRADLATVAGEVRERANGRVLAEPIDVTQDTAVEMLIERVVGDLGRLDVLVASAGTAAFGPVAESKPADWDAMLAVNLRATMVCCRAALAPMMRQRSGTILTVASIAAKRVLPGSAVYTATKMAVDWLQPRAGRGDATARRPGGRPGAGGGRHAALGHPGGRAAAREDAAARGRCAGRGAHGHAAPARLAGGAHPPARGGYPVITFTSRQTPRMDGRTAWSR